MSRKLSNKPSRIDIYPIGTFRRRAAYPYRMRSAYLQMELVYYYKV
jgi:hypothetical protein